MNKTLQCYDIAKEMKQSYDCLLFLEGETKFLETVKEWRGIFVTVMERENLKLIESLIHILSKCEGKPNEGMLRLVLIAVAFELAEEPLIKGTDLCLPKHPKELSTEEIGRLVQLFKCTTNS